MAAIKPFSYLTGETRAPKSGFRKPDEIYGTALRPEEQNHGEEARQYSHSQILTSHQEEPSIALPIYAQSTIDLDLLPVSQKPEMSHPFPAVRPPDVNQIQTNSETGTRQPEMATSGAKKGPDVAPKTKHKYEEVIISDDDSCAGPRFVIAEDGPPRVPTKNKYDEILIVDEGPRTSREHFYGHRQTNKSPEPSRDDQQTPEGGESAGKLYGVVQKRRDSIREVQHNDVIKRDDVYPPPRDLTTEGMPPFSYTPAPELILPSTGNGKGKDTPPKPSYFQAEIGDYPSDGGDQWPTSSSGGENPSIFDNFILVGPGKTEPREEEATARTSPPQKRLKLEELFDPPPHLAMESRKVSILGVTNTESSDFQNGPLDPHRFKNNGRVKAMSPPLSPFDNQDYNVQRQYNPFQSSSMDFADDRSQAVLINPPLTISHSKSSAASSLTGTRSQKTCCDRRLCIAILVTAIVTAFICLGAGFVAGWFGREEALRASGSNG